MEEVQRVRSLGARGAGAEIASAPVVQMKARRRARGLLSFFAASVRDGR